VRGWDTDLFAPPVVTPGQIVAGRVGTEIEFVRLTRVVELR
jgi:hypothetical protein